MVLDKLVQNLHLPILGVVEPGVNAALAITQNKRIGVIGTRATITSGTYEKKLEAKDREVKVFSQACPLFVPLAEEGWLDGHVTVEIAKIYLEPLIDQGIDTLILGCTHYPLLKPVFQEILGDVRLIDSAEETARLLARRLKMIRKERKDLKPPVHSFYVSDIPYLFQQVGERFLKRKIEPLYRVDIEAMQHGEEAIKGGCGKSRREKKNEGNDGKKGKQDSIKSRRPKKSLQKYNFKIKL